LRGFDLSTWQGILLALIGVALVTLISMGIRLLMMFTVQQRRERMNRQINERLRTLIAAYKTLGGSFTGNLAVDPTHLRDLRRSDPAPSDPAPEDEPRSDRSRRIRDAVEAALSDVILLGTEEQVRLAEHAARELVAGRPVHTHALVVSLRDFIREALDLAPIPADIEIPHQGPARPSSLARRAKGGRSERAGGGKGEATMAGGMGPGLGIGSGDPPDREP
jgi:hypothetical protein